MFSVTVDDVEYKVKFSHLETKRGMRTVCLITYESGAGLVGSSGYAYCSPEDQFNRAIGRQISLRRAVWYDYKVIPNYPVKVRKAIYDKYFSMTKPVSVKEHYG